MTDPLQPKPEDRCADLDAFVVFNGPLLFELCWGLLLGAAAWLVVVYRRYPDPDTLPSANLALLLTACCVTTLLDVGLRWFDRIGSRFTVRLLNQRRCGVLVMVPAWVWALCGIALALTLYYLVPPEEVDKMPPVRLGEVVGEAPTGVTHRASKRPGVPPPAPQP